MVGRAMSPSAGTAESDASEEQEEGEEQGDAVSGDDDDDSESSPGRSDASTALATTTVAAKKGVKRKRKRPLQKAVGKPRLIAANPRLEASIVQAAITQALDRHVECAETAKLVKATFNDAIRPYAGVGVMRVADDAGVVESIAESVLDWRTSAPKTVAALLAELVTCEFESGSHPHLYTGIGKMSGTKKVLFKQAIDNVISRHGALLVESEELHEAVGRDAKQDIKVKRQIVMCSCTAIAAFVVNFARELAMGRGVLPLINAVSTNAHFASTAGTAVCRGAGIVFADDAAVDVEAALRECVRRVRRMIPREGIDTLPPRVADTPCSSTAIVPA